MYLTAFMGRLDKKKKKNKANQEKDPQEVRNDEKRITLIQRMNLKKFKMMRQQNSMSFKTRRVKRFGMKLSKNCPQVKPLISLT